MRTSAITLLGMLLAIGSSSAELPRKKSLNSYSHLWTNSPFTSKPPPAKQEEQPSAMDDWNLGGVSEVEGGYMITLQHKKNAGESQIITPRGTMKYFADHMEDLATGASGTFKVDRVEFKSSWMDTVVHLSSGGRTGVVKFDDKTTTPKAAAAPPPRVNGQQPQPGQPIPQPGAVQQPNAQQQQPVRPPRPRVATPNRPTR